MKHDKQVVNIYIATTEHIPTACGHQRVRNKRKNLFSWGEGFRRKEKQFRHQNFFLFPSDFNVFK